MRYLGEFGVVFLMFVIGLEFNLPKLRAMQRHVFGLGLMQVAVTMVAGHRRFAGLSPAVRHRYGTCRGRPRWRCRARWP